MSNYLGDVRTSTRALIGAPSYTLITVCCLVLGLGGNATIFGITDALFFRPPPRVRDPQSVGRLYFQLRPKGLSQITTELASLPIHESLRANTTSFDDVAAYQVVQISEGVGVHAVMLRAAVVTETYFPLLGVTASQGRLLAERETDASEANAAVISDGLWRRRFGASPNVTSNRLHIAGQDFAIVGVAPRGFVGVDIEPVDVWLSMERTANDLIMPGYATKRGAMAISELVRLKPGVLRTQAEADVTSAYQNTVRSWWEVDSTARVIVAPLLRELGPKQTEQARVAKWLAGVSLAVMLIAAINSLNLMLNRALRREREFEVRSALGATRIRLARLLLVENSLLALCGAALSIALATAASRVFSKLLLPEDYRPDLTSVVRTSGITLAIALTVAIVASLLCVWAVQGDTSTRIARRTRSGQTGKALLRMSLVVGQTAATMILLVGAGLFTVSLRNARAMDLGFDPKAVVFAKLDFSSSFAVRTDQAVASDLSYQRIVTRLRNLPGVASVAVSTALPFQRAPVVQVARSNVDLDNISRIPSTFAVASEDYQRTIGLRMVAGRWFSTSEYASSARDDIGVVVVSEEIAKTFWPSEPALGKCLVVDPPTCRTVVGVVRDVRQSNLREVHQAQVYLPRLSDPRVSAQLPHTLVVRSSSGAAVHDRIREAIQAGDPAAPYITVEDLQAIIDPAVRSWRLGAEAFAFFATLALALAAIGLYGAMSSLVVERRRELAVRIALGAERRDVALLVVRQALLIATAGLAAGTIGAFLAGTSISALLFKVGAHEPRVFAVAAITLLMAALLACYSPISRAACIDPMVALRHN